jgi:hypothetical protein
MHDAADRDAVSDVVIGHERDLIRCARTDANLVQRAIISLTEYGNLVIENLHAYHESDPHLLLVAASNEIATAVIHTPRKSP